MKCWLSGEYYQDVIGASCKKLFDARLKQPRPHLDDKDVVMTSERSLSYCIKASSEDASETSEVEESGLKEKWDAIENKSMVVIYEGGAVIGVWLASTVVDAINGVPMVPKFMELIGLGCTGWFICLLFK
ncbi:curvature thylakoid 1A, chloroplastic-like protein, partial [Tanacetum coccineum]